MNLFFLVLAIDERYVEEKIRELTNFGFPYLIVCGKPLNHPNVLYREVRGKYDAINFGVRFVPKSADVVVLNDVDTKIHNLQDALNCFDKNEYALVYARVTVKRGPQTLFYMILDFIRRKIQVAASGELMLIKHAVLKEVLPIKPCKAEDSFILFKVLELKYKAAFCEECYVETERTKTPDKEVNYKRRTVAGLYQALSYTKPPPIIRVFFYTLPFASPLLLVLGKRGYFWMKGILLGLSDHLRGDKTGSWQQTYLD
jgi:cellulose synthase/poly-beta-1,6-N-acetylglucosamine synthase-like glycosyltransferase